MAMSMAPCTRPECNQCGEAETGRRWFCRECHDDLCFACFPAPVSKKQALANSSAAAASSQEDQDDDDDGDQQSEDVADTQLLLDFFVELARSRGDAIDTEVLRSIAVKYGGDGLADDLVSCDLAIADAVAVETARIMSKVLKPVAVKRKIKLQHMSAAAVVDAAKAAAPRVRRLSGSSDDNGEVMIKVSIVSPPLRAG